MDTCAGSPGMALMEAKILRNSIVARRFLPKEQLILLRKLAGSFLCERRFISTGSWWVVFLVNERVPCAL